MAEAPAPAAAGVRRPSTPAVLAGALPGIVVGLDVAAVRLVIAGLGVDTSVPAQLEAP